MPFIIFAKFCSKPYFFIMIFFLFIYIFFLNLFSCSWAAKSLLMSQTEWSHIPWLLNHSPAFTLSLYRPTRPTLVLGLGQLSSKHMVLWNQDRHMDKIEYPWGADVDKKTILTTVIESKESKSKCEGWFSNTLFVT